MREPVVSVVIPTFDRARLLPRALLSVEAQTYPSLELVVVDDGSTDDTRSVVAELSGGMSRNVIYHRQQNTGCAGARNKGIEVSSGEWLLFLDSDDALETDAVASLVDTALEEGADFVYSPAIEVAADGRTRINRPVAAGSPRLLAREHFFDPNVRNGAVLFRAAAVRTLGGFDASLRYNEDTLLLQRMALRYHGAYYAGPTVHHHHHEDNKSSNRPEICRALLRSSEAVLAEFPDFREELGAGSEERLEEIRGELVRELLLRARFEEARGVDTQSIGLPEQLALILGSTVPVKLAAWLRTRVDSFRGGGS